MKYRQLLRAIESASQDLTGRVASIANQALVIRNWLVGAYLVEFEQRGEDRAKYGERLLPLLAGDLEKKGLIGFSETNLKQCRQCYRAYPQIRQVVAGFLSVSPIRSIRQTVSDESPAAPAAAPERIMSASSRSQSFPIRQTASDGLAAAFPAIRQTLSDQFPPSLPTGIKPLSPQLLLDLTWSHLLELLRLDDPLKRIFYENECLKGRWSVRQLQRQIGSLLFERTGLSKDKAAVLRRAQQQNRPPDIADLLRDPYVLEFTGLTERAAYSENELETALLNHLQSFLLELGVGFCFEARQKRITVGNRHDHVDLVFYHRLLRCHVLLDLKIRAFQHGDAGQMNFFLNWWKAHAVAPGDNPPVGIILCSDQDHATVEYAAGGIDQKLFITRYLVSLPSVKQLTRFLEQDRDRLKALRAHPPESATNLNAAKERSSRPKTAKRASSVGMKR